MIGKDMTKMTLPVSFNEPTSLLQRVTEDMVRHSLYTHMIATMWAARQCIGSRLRVHPFYTLTVKLIIVS